MLDTSARSKIMYKTPEEANEIIENMASSDYEVSRDRTI